MQVVYAALIFALSLPGVALAQESTGDPLEGMNRAVFAFNDAVDKVALEPLARGYRAVTPRPVRGGVSNVLANLRAPVTLANDILQAEPGRAGTTAGRFWINTTLGLVGVFDVARRMGLEPHSEDFGQTLGKWGLESGPYLVLPLLGPSSLRDATGRIVDAGFDPINYASFDGDDATRATRTVLTVVSGRESALEAVENVRSNSIDPYVSVRSSYLLLRQSAVQNGQTNVQDLPDFEEMPDQPESTPNEPEGSPS
jgi:phospholipid-binding lipoprotein MlaA